MKKVRIVRERYVILNKENKIFCGLARQFHFKKLDEIDDTPIKTYSSYEKARASFIRSWSGVDDKNFFTLGYHIEQVQESVISKSFYFAKPIKVLKSGINVYRVIYDGIHYCFGHRGDKPEHNFAEYEVYACKFYLNIDKEVDIDQMVDIIDFIKTTPEYKQYIKARKENKEIWG